jgi:hypothetical protein
MFEDPLFRGDLAYEYLAREASGAPGPHSSDWPAYSPSTGCAYPSFVAPPFPMFVQIWLYFLVFIQYLFPGITLRFPPHLLRRQNRPLRSTVNNPHQNRAAVKVHPRSTVPKGSGAAVCAEISFAISTNASGI